LVNEYRGDPGGCFKVFVAKLNSTGDVLLYSTYLGRGNYYVREFSVLGDIAATEDGHVYVTGHTSWHDFPTRRAFKDTPTGDDAFLARLNTNTSGDASLIYSTFLGGAGIDMGKGIAASLTGIAYVTGFTNAPDFPLQGFRPPAVSGDFDIFLAKFDTNASGDASLLWSTYLGGTAKDMGTAVAIGAGVAVTGLTQSPDLPVTPGAYQATHANTASYDAFVMKWADPVDTAIPLPDGPGIFYYPLSAFSLMRPYPSGCQPLSAAQISQGCLNLKVSLPKFQAPVHLYLALYGSEAADANNIADPLNLPPNAAVWFVNGQGQLEPGLTPWKMKVTDAVDQLVAVDVSSLEVSQPYVNVALIALAPGSPPVDQPAVEFTQPDRYYAWVTQLPVPREQYEEALLSLQELLTKNLAKQNRSLKKAVYRLQTSLNPELWLDSFTLSELGFKVFEAHRQTVHELTKGKVPQQEVAPVLEILLRADARLAANAVVDAITQGGPPRQLTQARRFQARAVQEQAAGNLDQAVGFYGKAWNVAEQAFQAGSAQPTAKGQ